MKSPSSSSSSSSSTGRDSITSTRTTTRTIFAAAREYARPTGFPWLVILIAFLASNAFAQTNTDSNATPIPGNVPRFHLERSTNALSDAEIDGQKLVRQLADTMPAEDATNACVLEIRRNGSTQKFPCRFETALTATNWQVMYKTTGESYRVTFAVAHNGQKTELYEVRGNESLPVNFDCPFAGSDFWMGDLGLEFFHWPDQKIIKKEFARGRGCMVLESTNPNPTNGYSKVDCWIDEETLGIVQAQAFDAKGKLLKEFQPKSFKKVNGQWQLQDMEIRNVQTGSRTTIRFDLKAN